MQNSLQIWSQELTNSLKETIYILYKAASWLVPVGTILSPLDNNWTDPHTIIHTVQWYNSLVKQS